MKDGLFGCLLVIFFMILTVAIHVGMGLFLTWAVIWVSNGLFNYDLSDKFWYVFVVIFFILPILRSTFSIRINK